MSRHTSDEGVFRVWEAISVLEQITLEPWEHSASENYYARKLHYERKRTAGYSFWPMGGWEALWNRMAEAFVALGGTIQCGRPSSSGSRSANAPCVAPGVERRASARRRSIEACEVIVDCPPRCWDLDRLFDPDVLPWDLRHRIRALASNRNKACWFGYSIAAREPVIAMSELEMASLPVDTASRASRIYAEFHRLRGANVSPGEYLTCVGAAFDATRHWGDRAYYERKFSELWADVEMMPPPEVPSGRATSRNSTV